MTDQIDANTEAESEVIDNAQVNENVEVDVITDSSPEENGVQKRINKITADKYQIQREKDELAKELAELKSQQPVEPQSDIVAPQLPDDLYDEDAMRQYHADNQKYVAEITTNNVKNVIESQQKTVTEQQQQARQREVVTKYAENAQRDGVTIEKLQVAEASLNQAGISPQLGQYLLNDVNGGKIVEYLHDNPDKLHEIVGLDPVSAGVKINSEVRAAALSKTPKVSNAPEPTPDIRGGGYKEVDDFEKKYPGAQFI